MLNELTKAEEYKKDTDLIEQGTVVYKLIFLTSGIVSSVYKTQNKRFIRDFYFQPQIFTEQESFIKKTASKFSVSAGVYLYSIVAGENRQTKKMIFLK